MIMKKGFIIPVFLVMVCLFLSCGQSFDIDPNGREVVIDFSDSGYNVVSPHVFIQNYQTGKRADITFLINNKSSRAIEATLVKIFNVQPENNPTLAGKGYQSIPQEYTDWIVIPHLTSIQVNKSARYTMTLQIPKGIELPKRWTFVVSAASNTGGFFQVGFGVWIVVNMR